MILLSTVLNNTALRCTTPAVESAGALAVEVTLNGDVSAHTLTSDGVTFDFFNASAIRIDSIAPLGGPSEGGTLVTLVGGGLGDVELSCRFGDGRVVRII